MPEAAAGLVVVTFSDAYTMVTEGDGLMMVVGDGDNDGLMMVHGGYNDA